MSYFNRIPSQELTAFYEDGTRIVSLSISILLFTNKSFTEIPSETLFVYESFFEKCNKTSLTFYQNENMTNADLTNKNTFGLLEKWLRKKGAGRKKMIHLRLQDRDNYADTPDYAFILSGVEEGMTGYGEDANMIRLVFPAFWGENKYNELLELVSNIISIFPISSGLAGFNLERSNYHINQADPIVWRLAMDYNGSDIARETEDRVGVGFNGIKGVNWLTLLSNKFSSDLDIKNKISQINQTHKLTELSNGTIIIRATDYPILGIEPDELEPYKDIFSLVEPLMLPTLSRFGAFCLPGDDHIAKTDEWLMRLKR